MSIHLVRSAVAMVASAATRSTIYSAAANATVWVLQYQVDGNGNNAERIAVSVGEPNLQNLSFFAADMTPQQIGQPNGIWADFPHVAVNSGFFYLTYNMFNSAGSYVGTAINRVPLADLTNGGGFGYNFFTTTLGTTLPVSGAGSTIYLGTHLDNDTLRVWSWPDSSNSISQNDVNHTSFLSSSYVCTTNDGFDPCGRASSRVRGGWVGGGIIGFSWDAGQGDDGWAGTFAYPYTFVVRINQSSFALIDQPIIWNGSFAWFYGGVAANGRGHVGISISLAGGATYPGSQIFIADDIGGPWQGGFFVASSTNTPAANRWGDYLTTRAINGNGYAWVGASYVLVGACVGGGTDCDNVRVHYTVFGRERDYFNCPDDNYEWDNDWSRSTFMNPSQDSNGHAFCSSEDQDWFRFSGVAGNQYRIETRNLAGGNDTVLTLYNSSLTQLASDDDGGPEFRSSLINYVVPANGTYYVKATRFNGFRNFAYTYDLRITRDFPPETTPPSTTVIKPQTMGNPSAGVYTVNLRTTWMSSDSPQGVASQQLQLKLGSGAYNDVSPQPTPSGTSFDRRFNIGDAFRWRVRAFDTLGANSAYKTGAALTLRGSGEGTSEFAYTGTWVVQNKASAWNGKQRYTTGGAGTKVVYSYTGRRAGLVVMTGPNAGKADIYVDGVKKATLDFYTPSPEYRQIVYVTGATSLAAHTLEVRWRSDRNAASTGNRIFLDGVVVLR